MAKRRTGTYAGWITCLAILIAMAAITSDLNYAQESTYTFTRIADSTRPGGLSNVGCVGLNNLGTVIAKFIPAGSTFFQLWRGDGQTFTQVAPRVDGPCASINDLNETAYIYSPGPGEFHLVKNSSGVLTVLARNTASTVLDPLATYLPSLSNTGSASMRFRSVGFEAGILVAPSGPLVFSPATDPSLTAVSTASMNDSHTVAFRAFRTVGGVSRVGAYRGSTTPLIETGTLTSEGTIQISPFFIPVVNNSGTVAFGGSVPGGAVSLYTTTDGVSISRVGTEPLERPIAINDAGTVVFRRDADGGGLFAGRPGAINMKVIGIGDPIDGSTLATFSLWEEAINASGQIAFFAQLADGRTGVYRAEPQTNHAPVAHPGSLDAVEDTVATGSLLADDADNDPLTFSIVTDGQLGTVTITDASTGAFIYTPIADAGGPDVFTFQATDGTEASNVATVNILVEAVNDAPVASPSVLPTFEDTPMVSTFVANDIDGPALTFSIIQNGTIGTAEIIDAATGLYRYTPLSNVSGNDSVTFQVSDGSLDSNVAAVSIEVAAMNDAPLAAPGSLNTNEDTNADGILAATDIDSPSLTFSIVSGPAKGTVTITNPTTGAYTYTPNPDANGPDSFTFKTNDSSLDSNVARVEVSITAVNDAPVANGASVATVEDAAISGTLTALDVDANTLTFTPVSGGAKGRVTMNAATGAFTYTPNRNANGDDSFAFRVNDGLADSAIATVFITITAVNDAPVAYGHSAFVLEDTPTPIRLESGDPENAPLTYTVATPPAHGTLSGIAPDLTYSPAPNYNGPDGFTFVVSDGSANSGGATINLTVSQVMWTPLGPEGGRVFGLAVDPTTPTTLYASTSGGVFRSTDGSATWSLRSDGLTRGVSALALDPITPTTLYAATSSGVFRSTDSGATWVPRSSGLTAGGGVFEVAIHPTTPTILYAATNGSGVFRSIDGGANWAPRNAGLTNFVVRSLVIDPGSPATLYAGTLGGGVFRSTDGGASWIPRNTGLTNASIFTLAVDPRSPTTLYAGTGGGGVFRSTDGGASWVPRNAGLIGAANLLVVAVTMDPTTVDALYLGTSGGIFRSIDAGATWVPRGVGPNVVTRAIAVLPTSPVILYTATDGGVFQSTDEGTHWVLRNAGLTSHVVQVLGINPVTSATVYSGTDRELFGSVDGGSTWTTQSLGFTVGVRSLAIDPTTPTTLYSGTDLFVFRSTDGGQTWLPRNTGFASTFVNALAIHATTPTLVYAGTQTGVFRSPNSGASWVPSNGGLTQTRVLALTIDPSTPTTLYVGTNAGGVFRSTDGGGNWSPRNTGLTDLIVQSLAIDPNTPGTLYAGTLSSGVFWSTDGGATWAPRRTGLTTLSVRHIAIDPTTPTTLYAATSGGGVFRSMDKGATWTELNVGLTSHLVQTLAIDPAAPATLYAGTAGGNFVLRTANDRPLASDGELAVTEDTVGAGTLIATDPEGQGITYAIVDSGALGTAVLSDAVTGAFTYTPDPDANGSDSFTFTASDGTSTSEVATVTVTITPVNDAPTADVQSVTTAEETAQPITLTGSDPDSDLLTFNVIAAPTHGTLSGTAPNLTYTPDVNYNGPDSFTFRTNDGLADSNVAAVSITVTPENDAPIATIDSYDTNEDTPLTVVAPGVLANDTDQEGNPLTATQFSGATHGVVTLNADGSFVYTPAANYHGPDSFTYRPHDGAAAGNAATVTIAISPVNDAPVLATLLGDVTVAQNSPDTVLGLSSTFSDPDIATDGDTLTFAVAANSNPGLVTANLVGTTLTLQYAPNQAGAATITIRATDAHSDFVEDTFAVTVTAPTGPVLSISDVVVIEGNGGTKNATFSVTLSPASTQTVTVAYALTGATATAGVDFVSASGTLTFAPGVISRPITVRVTGDLLDEDDETYAVNLSAPTNATIGDGQGLGTITDNDTSRLSIADVTISEGNAGSVNALFTVSLSLANTRTVTVDYNTALNGSGTSGTDYQPIAGVLAFAPGVLAQTVSVAVIGDVLDEIDETYFVTLTNPTVATIQDGSGKGTITDDDPEPTISISDVTIPEGNSGFLNAVLTVTLSAPSSRVVRVDYATADGTALEPGDYTAKNATVSFAAGTTVQQITVRVRGDLVNESDEIFLVNLSNPRFGTILDGQGIGTILDNEP